MQESANGHHSKGPQEVVEDLRREFVEEAVETIQGLDMDLDAARHGRRDLRKLIKDIRRAAVLLRGQAANFSMRSLAAVCHRLDEYLAHAPEVLPPRTWDDLQSYLDLITALAEGKNPPQGDSSTMVRSLPIKLGFDLGDIEVRNVEVLVVMPVGAQTRFVERELQQCGYRVSVVPDTLQAFAMIVHTKPDMVIVSAVMPDLDGLDLAIALSSMPSTRNIPMAVITSLDPHDERLQLLPKKVPVVYKGPTFGDDLFSALDNLFLI
jgi:CheY-like chemotaxis protein/HPt (histidine-containing phosphotransfer) domain-containing protein